MEQVKAVATKMIVKKVAGVIGIKWILGIVLCFTVLIGGILGLSLYVATNIATTIASTDDNVQTGTCNDLPTSLSGNGAAQQIYLYLTQSGLTPIAASGVEGNLAQESQLNPSEPGGGLAQWINGRWTNLEAFAMKNNANVNGLGTQLAFLMTELRSGQHGSISVLNSQPNPGMAAVYFEQAFEGASMPRLDNRINYANGFYNQFAGMPTVSKASQPVISNVCGSSSLPNAPASTQAAKVIKFAEQFLGLPYVWGGTTPAGFDCSGFMMYSFRNALGINLPRTAAEQQLVGTRIPTNQVQPGDLVFMGFPAFHVGMYIGGGKWIESPETGESVKIVPYNPSHFTSATRVLN